MKIVVDILENNDGNPHNQEYYKLFKEVKTDIEQNITKYAKLGILPSINDDLIAIHKDNSTSSYEVFSRTFYKDKVFILVKWI